MSLTKIIQKNKTKDIKIEEIDKYVFELIRVSRMYKFDLKLNLKPVKEKNNPKPIEKIEDLVKQDPEELKKREEEINEIKPYHVLRDGKLENTEILYENEPIKISKSESYAIEKPKKIEYQELDDKEGFYKERTTQTRVKVQIWPEHLPYDHYKRKRAFLFV